VWSWGEGLADDKWAWGALGASESPVICVLLTVTWIHESVNSQRTIYKNGQFTLTFILILNINIYIYIYINTYAYVCIRSRAVHLF